jgi:hypothetical protein
VTLAGAAEGMFELRSGLWGFMLHSPNAAALAEAMEVERDKKLINYMNDLRDWLKHERPEAGQTRTITMAHAAFMIARAMSKLTNWSPTMTKSRQTPIGDERTASRRSPIATAMPSSACSIVSKDFRRIATRYDRLADNFLVCLAATVS